MASQPSRTQKRLLSRLHMNMVHVVNQQRHASFIKLQAFDYNSLAMAPASLDWLQTSAKIVLHKSNQDTLTLVCSRVRVVAETLTEITVLARLQRLVLQEFICLSFLYSHTGWHN